MPIRKPGTDMVIWLKIVSTRSITPPWYRAASRPTGSDTATMSTKAMAVRVRVTPMRGARSCPTGRAKLYETPRSPVSRHTTPL